MATPDTVFVTIKSVGRIPFINRSGPITTPISLSRTIAASLKALGYAVIEHKAEDVAIDSNTSKRRLVSVEDFVAATPADEVNVDSNEQPVVVTPAAPAYVPNMVATDVVNAPIATDSGADADDADDTEGVDASSESSDGAEESDELAVYPLDTYKGWTKKKRHEYLVAASSLLPPDVAEKLDDMSTAELLSTIEKYIVNAAA